MSKRPSDTRTWRAPGRVNIVGEHIDYLGGVVLPFACDLEVRLVCRPSEHVAVSSEYDDGGLERYVDGVLAALREAGYAVHGVRGELTSTIPVGAGLSSSAAVEVAVALAVTDGARIDPSVLQRAEELATGVPCGVMDQATILGARAGHALLLDCATGNGEHVPVPTAIGFVVIDTGTRRRLRDGRYAARRAEVEAELGGTALADAHRAGIGPDAPPRLRHAVSEYGRVLAAVDALRVDDVAGLGDIVDASHASLRDDFEVSSEALDRACEIARAHEACAGARLVGAGFAGCCLAVVPAGRARDVAVFVEERAPEMRAYPVRAVDAAGAA